MKRTSLGLLAAAALMSVPSKIPSGRKRENALIPPPRHNRPCDRLSSNASLADVRAAHAAKMARKGYREGVGG